VTIVLNSFLSLKQITRWQSSTIPTDTESYSHGIEVMLQSLSTMLQCPDTIATPAARSLILVLETLPLLSSIPPTLFAIVRDLTIVLVTNIHVSRRCKELILTAIDRAVLRLVWLSFRGYMSQYDVGPLTDFGVEFNNLMEKALNDDLIRASAGQLHYN
jgi:hypothetical protein